MAVSFIGLGNEGRLGNQMFQYAFIRGLAANRGFDWIIPGPDADRLDNYGLFDAFELTNCDLNKNTGEPFYKNVESSYVIFPRIKFQITRPAFFSGGSFINNPIL